MRLQKKTTTHKLTVPRTTCIGILVCTFTFTMSMRQRKTPPFHVPGLSLCKQTCTTPIPLHNVRMWKPRPGTRQTNFEWFTIFVFLFPVFDTVGDALHTNTHTRTQNVLSISVDLVFTKRAKKASLDCENVKLVWIAHPHEFHFHPSHYFGQFSVAIILETANSLTVFSLCSFYFCSIIAVAVFLSLCMECIVVSGGSHIRLAMGVHVTRYLWWLLVFCDIDCCDRPCNRCHRRCCITFWLYARH